MLEKDIERVVCEYAKERGALVYKFTSPNRAAVPDRLFIVPGGKVFFCEFKRTGQKPTPPQLREHVRISAYGCHVHVIDNIKDGYAMVDYEIG